MKTCKRCADDRPYTEFRKDSRYRDGHSSWCKACHRERGSSWARENRERLTEKSREWRAANPAKVLAADRKWKSANKSAISEQYRTWRRANLDYDRARAAARKAAKLRAIPKWADIAAISEFYRNTEPGHQVDHIVPLTSPIVCGLHCEANLQYLTASENQSKRNFWWTDMPGIDAAYRQQRLFA